MREKKVSLAEQLPQPHDLETERSVLSSLMMYNGNLDKYGDILNVDLFYYEKEKAIYRTVSGVIHEGHITDVNSLYSYTQSHDVRYQLERSDFVNLVSYWNKLTIEQDVYRLRDMSRRRKMWLMLQEASQCVFDMTNDYDETVNQLASNIGELHSQTSAEEVASFGDALNEIQEIADGNLSGKSQALITGFALFDNHYLLRPQTLTVIAAFPAVGKSALALNIAEAVARQGVPSAYYSMEMGKSELVSRAISEQMDLPAYVIMNKPLNDVQRENLSKVIKSNSRLPIYFDDRATVSFDRVIRSIRTLVKTNGIKLAIIDYLQIFNQTSDDEEKGMSYMARMCKNIAKETNISVIVLSQLNRSALHPSLRMLRGSGQIEESADNVVLIDRPEAYPDNNVTKYEGEFAKSSIVNTAKLILAKGRGVGVGSSLVAFNGRHTRFSDIKKPEGGSSYEHDDNMPF